MRRGRHSFHRSSRHPAFVVWTRKQALHASGPCKIVGVLVSSSRESTWSRSPCHGLVLLGTAPRSLSRLPAVPKTTSCRRRRSRAGRDGGSGAGRQGGRQEAEDAAGGARGR